MGKEVLEQLKKSNQELKNQNDLISRQAAIEVVDAVWSVTGDKNVAKVWDQIKDLPSAQPKQRWIPYGCHYQSRGEVTVYANR